MDITLELFARFSQKLCYALLHIIGIMCSKFLLDDLNTFVQGIWDTIFHQQTNHLPNRPPAQPTTCPTDHLLTPVYTSSHFIS